MSRWLKLDTDAWKHGKLAELNDAQFRAYIGAMSEQKNLDGEPFASEKHFALMLGPYAKYLKALVAARLVDRLGNGRLSVHNFEERQRAFTASAERQRQYRARRKGASPQVDNGVDNRPGERESTISDGDGDATGDITSDITVTHNGASRIERHRDDGDREVERERKKGQRKKSPAVGSESVDPKVAEQHRREVQKFIRKFGIEEGQGTP